MFSCSDYFTLPEAARKLSKGHLKFQLDVWQGGGQLLLLGGAWIFCGTTYSSRDQLRSGLHGLIFNLLDW